MALDYLVLYGKSRRFRYAEGVFSQVPPQASIREHWMAHTPPPEDLDAWKALIAETEAEGYVILELFAETGFRVIHTDLPGDQIVYVRVPRHKLEFFTLNIPIQVKPSYVID